MPLHPSYQYLDAGYFAEMVSFGLKRSIGTYLALGGRVHFEQSQRVAEESQLTITDENGVVLFSAAIPDFLRNALSEWEFAG